jgi:hypothetical protein
VLAHDIPLAYNPSVPTCLKLALGAEVAMSVSDGLIDDKAQVVCVSLPTWLRFRGMRVHPPHVTLSLVDGVDEGYAAVLINTIKSASTDQDDLATVVSVPNNARVLHGIFGVRLSNGAIVYSANELQMASSSVGAREGQVGGVEKRVGDYNPLGEQAEKSINLASLVQCCLPRVDVATRSPICTPMISERLRSPDADVAHAALKVREESRIGLFT